MQLWLRPTKLEPGAVVLELGEDPTSRPSLQIGERGSLVLRQGATSIVAPGALSEDRWVAITLTIARDGAATLGVDGARAAVGALPPLADTGASVRLGEPRLGAAFAIAELRVHGKMLAPDATPRLCYRVIDGALVDAQRGPAPVIGDSRVIDADEVPALLTARPGALVWDGPQDGLELPALTADLCGGVTMEAWIRPRLGKEPLSIVELGRPRGEATVGLVIDGRGLVVEVLGAGAQQVRVDEVLRPDAWQHVCATVDGKGLCKIHVDARLVHEQAIGPIPPARDAVRTLCGVGRGRVKYRGYHGEIAELRVWQGARPSEDIAARWLRRACGDEPGLLLCYHLDDLPGGFAIDAGPRRLHARAEGTLTLGEGRGLPLRARDERGGPHVRTAGKLLIDHLPLSLFADPRLLPEPTLPWGPKPAKPGPAARDYGTVQGSLVRCAVYEAVFEPRTADGRKRAGTVDVRVDARVMVLRCDGGQQRLVEWVPGAAQRLVVSDSGRVRVKLLAGSSLDCPTLRVRAPGMAEDCWTLVRPADIAQQQLRDLSATALQRPPPGKSAVLDPKLSKADADALTGFMRQVAGGLAVPARSSAIPKGKNIFEDIGGTITGGAEAFADAVVDLGKDIEELAVAGVEQTKKLAAKAAKTAAQTGEAVIRGCIKDARTLAVDTGSAVWGGVQVIGERVVDGVKQTFRTVVAGVLDVVDALEAFLRRIGASIRAFIEFLAMLLDWDRIIKMSDDLYELTLRQFDHSQEVAAQISGLTARIDALVAGPRDGSLAGETLGAAFGIDAGAELPDIDELNYLVDAIEDAFTSSPPKYARDEQPTPGPTQLDAASVKQAHAEVVAAHPQDLLDWPGDPLALAMDGLLAAPERMWSAGRPVIDPLTRWVGEQTQSLFGRARGTLTARLEVPYLTDLIEVVILRGRKLDLLRLISLVGAVPAVASGGSTHTTKSTKSTNQETSTQAKIRWSQFGVSVCNSGLLIGRAVAEWSKKPAAMVAFDCLSGSTTVALGLLDFALAVDTETGAARDLAITHAMLGCFGGMWMVASRGWSLYATAASETALRETVDGIVEGVIGVGEVATTIAGAVVTGVDRDELGSVLGFRVGNWVLRGVYRMCNGLDNTGWKYASAATTACGGAILLADLSEGIYAIVGHAQG